MAQTADRIYADDTLRGPAFREAHHLLLSRRWDELLDTILSRPQASESDESRAARIAECRQMAERHFHAAN